MEKRKRPHVAGGDVIWESAWKPVCPFLKKLTNLPYNLPLPLLDIYPREKKIHIHSKAACLSRAALLKKPNTANKPSISTTGGWADEARHTHTEEHQSFKRINTSQHGWASKYTRLNKRSQVFKVIRPIINNFQRRKIYGDRKRPVVAWSLGGDRRCWQVHRSTAASKPAFLRSL